MSPFPKPAVQAYRALRFPLCQRGDIRADRFPWGRRYPRILVILRNETGQIVCPRSTLTVSVWFAAQTRRLRCKCQEFAHRRCLKPFEAKPRPKNDDDAHAVSHRKRLNWNSSIGPSCGALWRNKREISDENQRHSNRTCLLLCFSGLVASGIRRQRIADRIRRAAGRE